MISVRIRLAALADNLSTFSDPETPVTAGDAHQTLLDQGFIYIGRGWWQCDRTAMQFLFECEIAERK